MPSWSFESDINHYTGDLVATMASKSSVQIRRRPLDANKALMVYRSDENPETLSATQVRRVYRRGILSYRGLDVCAPNPLLWQPRWRYRG